MLKDDELILVVQSCFNFTERLKNDMQRSVGIK